ncbi:hypothetical protein E3E12_07665 [Formicincola oecophyllae]|uniref:Uncharacterized protein n=1 Tax=Formicincola oecophyllae TaxID=2558361 RepID=A0A4Y6U9D0_9PROT|nr:hypothetical protein [Formicincola oecophyllae]QDH14073.1 hypothetical protein E3E12_07665 [Formicincola oecophyllae]
MSQEAPTPTEPSLPGAASVGEGVYAYALKGDISSLQWPPEGPGTNRGFAREELVLARHILGLLVRQVKARQPVTYSALARELGWSPSVSATAALQPGGDTPLNDPAAPRFLGLPLNALGVALEGPRTPSGTIILPPLEVMVVESSPLPEGQVPGLGFYRFWRGPVDWGQMAPAAKAHATKALQEQVYACPLWGEVERILTTRNPQVLG